MFGRKLGKLHLNSGVLAKLVAFSIYAVHLLQLVLIMIS